MRYENRSPRRLEILECNDPQLKLRRVGNVELCLQDFLKLPKN